MLPENLQFGELAVFAAYAITTVLLLATIRKVRGTTLIGPWVWAVGSMVFLMLAEYTAKTSQSPSSIQYVAAVGLFCPMMSLLGAKRPQHSAWHLIVASLWVVLVLPAAESYFLRQGGKLQIHDARGWFLWLLIGTGWLNHVLTRHWIACTLLAAAQVLLLTPHLPLLGEMQISRAVPAMLIASAAILVFVSRSRTAKGLDRVWLDFRDAYGTFWGVRVVDRVNADSQRYDWPLRLEWMGIAQVDSPESPPDVPEEAANPEDTGKGKHYQLMSKRLN